MDAAAVLTDAGFLFPAKPEAKVAVPEIDNFKPIVRHVRRNRCLHNTDTRTSQGCQ